MPNYFKGIKHSTFEESFWAKVDKKGERDCWEWQASRHPRSGYGQVNQSGRMKKAHRVAWEFTNGAIPNGIYVCHKCDNPPCCNPNHLFLGTQLDNMNDCGKKGRKQTILSEEQVIEIRRLYLTENITQAAIGKIFGVSNKVVSEIVKGNHSWKWTFNPKNPKCRPRRKISDLQIAEIRCFRADGLTHKEIAVKYGVNESQISRILAGKRRNICASSQQPIGMQETKI